MAMNYIKSILIFGFILPAVILGGVIGGVWYGFSWFKDEYAIKSRAYQQMLIDKTEADKLRAELLPLKGAVAYFDSIKSENIEEKLPPYIIDLCDGEFEGFVMRNSLDFSEGGEDGTRVQISFVGRYDSLQKLLANLSRRFLFLETVDLNIAPQTPSTSIPSNHLTLDYSGLDTRQRKTSGSNDEFSGGDQ